MKSWLIAGGALALVALVATAAAGRPKPDADPFTGLHPGPRPSSVLAAPEPTRAPPPFSAAHARVHGVLHRWRPGQFLSAGEREQRFWVDHRRLGLGAPPHGCEWVRTEHQYVLVKLSSGLVERVVTRR